MTNSKLSPDALDALKLIRALRRLPEMSGTVAAERRALNHLRLPDLNAVALILAEDDEEADRG
jgi:hypothetical protein